MRILLIGLTVLWCSTALLAQRPPETEAEFDKNYQRRIQQEYLDGKYIPADIGDAFTQLHKLIDRESKVKFKQAEEEAAVQKLHFSLGRWIILNWGFYEGSRLSHHLRSMGLHHPDDMARFLIRSFHRSLNEQPIAAKEQVESLNEAREAARRARLQEAEVLEEWRAPAKADSTQGMGGS